MNKSDCSVSRIKKWLLGISFIVLSAISVIPYVLEFGFNGFSEKTSDWANFAVYMSGTVGILVVMSTLIVLIGTFNQQQKLVDGQSEIVEARKNATTVMLYHHFATLEQMFELAIEALGSDVKSRQHAHALINISSKRPDLYSSLLMNEDAKVMDLFYNLEGQMLLDSVSAVVNAKEVFEYLSFLAGEDGERSIAEIKSNLSNSKYNVEYLTRAKKGLAACNQAMAEVKSVIAKINNQL